MAFTHEVHTDEVHGSFSMKTEKLEWELMTEALLSTLDVLKVSLYAQRCIQM